MVSPSPISIYNLETYYLEIFNKVGIPHTTGFFNPENLEEMIGRYVQYDRNGKPKSITLFDYYNTIAYFPEIASFSGQIKPCNKTKVDFHIEFLKNGNIKKAYYTDSTGAYVCSAIFFDKNNSKNFTIDTYGDLCSAYRETYTNRKKMEEGLYIDGKKSGEWLLNDESGGISHKEYYVKGRKKWEIDY